MPNLSAPELELVRTQPQSSELFLSIYQPQVVVSGLISGTYARGAMDIGYELLSGDPNEIYSGMTMLVGTSANSRDLGKIRVRSSVYGTVTVGANSNIDWATATHITILKYWEVWPIYPRNLLDPSGTTVTFYKDYDIPYTDQNSVLGAFPLAGVHCAGFVGDSFYWDSSETVHLVTGTTLSFDWILGGAGVGGSDDTSTDATPGFRTYDTAGHYVTALTISGDNGSIDTTYRYVSIYNRPPNATNTPIQKWSIDPISGSRGEGGYSTSIRITDEVPPEVNEGDVVVLWSDDWYGNTNQSLGGNSLNNSKIFFTGHVQNGTLKYDYKTSELTFQVGSITDTMKTAEAFGVSIGSALVPSKWYEMLDMDARRAIYHYLKWHSTVLFLADFRFMGDDRRVQYFDSDRESIFDAVDNYMKVNLLGDLCADRQGSLWAEVGEVMYTDPVGSFPTMQTLTKREWIGEPDIQQRLISEVSIVSAGGTVYHYSGVDFTGSFSTYLSEAPGEFPNTRGTVENIQTLTIDSQTHLNYISGNIYESRNSKYPYIDFGLAGNFRQFDIAPKKSITVDIPVEDTNLGVAINAPYLIDAVSWSYTPNDKRLSPTLSTASLVTGKPGASQTIPDMPESGGYGDYGGGFNFNPGSFPPFLGELLAGFSMIQFWHGSNTESITIGSGGTSVFRDFVTLYSNAGLTPIVYYASDLGGGMKVTEAGFYLVIFQVRTFGTDFTYVRINGVGSSDTVEMRPYFTMGSGEVFSGTTISPVYLNAGDFVRPSVTWSSPAYTPQTADLVSRMTVIKIGV